jgi:hypothetical protein
MSIDIMNRLWWRDMDADVAALDQTRYPGSGRNLFWTLIALADSSTDEGFAWPAVATLARKSRLGKRAVQMALKQAEALGMLRRRERLDASTQYLFVLERLPHVARPKRPKERGPIEYFEEAESDLFEGDAQDAPHKPAPVHPTTLTGESHDTDGRMGCTQNHHRIIKEPSSLSSEDIAREFAARWNALHDEVPKIPGTTQFSERRRNLLLRRVDDHGESPTRKPANVEALFDKLFDAIRASRFLRGEKKDWAINGVDWILNATNFTKVMEGYYGRDYSADAHSADPHNRSHVAAGQEAVRILRARRGSAGEGEGGLAR